MAAADAQEALGGGGTARRERGPQRAADPRPIRVEDGEPPRGAR